MVSGILSAEVVSPFVRASWPLQDNMHAEKALNINFFIAGTGCGDR